jgi:hypothetical protein
MFHLGTSCKKGLDEPRTNQTDSAASVHGGVAAWRKGQRAEMDEGMDSPAVSHVRGIRGRSRARSWKGKEYSRADPLCLHSGCSNSMAKLQMIVSKSTCFFYGNLERYLDIKPPCVLLKPDRLRSEADQEKAGRARPTLLITTKGASNGGHRALPGQRVTS